MRERAAATIAIWAAVALSISALVGSLTYQVQVLVNQQAINAGLPGVIAPLYAYSTEVMPTFWQLAVGGLVLAAISAGAISTIAVWRGAWRERTVAHQSAAKTAAQPNEDYSHETVKMKREDRSRLARLEHPGDQSGGPAYLEHLTGITDDSETVSSRRGGS